jgi:hypothetical protein
MRWCDFVKDLEYTTGTTGDMPLVKNDASYKAMLSTIAAAAGNRIDTVEIDSDLDPITTLPEDGQIVYIKNNDSEVSAQFAVAIEGQEMCPELISGLLLQWETIRVELRGNRWCKIS